MKDMFYYTNHGNNEKAKAMYNKRKEEYRKTKKAKSQYYGNKIKYPNNKSKETWRIIIEKLGRNKIINKKIVLN